MKINEIEIEDITLNNNLNSLFEKNYTSLDSYTINQNNNNVSSLIVLNREEKIPKKEEVENYFNNQINKKHMLNRLYLAKTINVPLYLISIENNFKECQILQLKLSTSYNNIVVNFFKEKEIVSSEELYDFFQNLRNEKRNKPKPLSHISSSDLISKFNQLGISLGGNLDGFFIDKVNRKFHIVEFSKIGAKKPDVEGSYTLNYNFDKFMNEDFGRWHALETLRSSIEKKQSVSLDVIVWSFSNNYMKIIKDVKFLGDRNKNLKPIYSKEIIFKDNILQNKIKF